MILTIDIGNSRIKWALWQADEIVDRAALSYETANSDDAFDKLFSALRQSSREALIREKPSRVFAICVAGNGVRLSLSDWVNKRWQQDVEYLETEKQYKNIINAYDNPDQHGVDRWVSIIAGHQRYPDSSVCVIGAGTAITFDLIKKSGQHLGGYILPSYVTMHAALLADTTNVVSASDAQFKKQGIPDNTNDAVNQGLHRLLQAGIRELCRHAQNELQDERDAPMQIVLTGGFAQTILSYPDMPNMQHEPDLVMQGLYSMMKKRKLEAGI
jgi:type III pantothenate kinase